MIDLFRLSVMTAIDLDNEAPRQTHEIDDVNAEWMLSAKAIVPDLPLAQFTPQLPLAVSHIAAQSTGTFVCHEIFYAWQYQAAG